MIFAILTNILVFNSVHKFKPLFFHLQKSILEMTQGLSCPKVRDEIIRLRSVEDFLFIQKFKVPYSLFHAPYGTIISGLLKINARFYNQLIN